MKYENHLTPNGRLYESGGVTPQKKQCVIASTSPAASAVAPAFIKPLGRYMKPKSNHHQPEKKIAPPKPTPRLIPTPLGIVAQWESQLKSESTFILHSILGTSRNKSSKSCTRFSKVAKNQFVKRRK